MKEIYEDYHLEVEEILDQGRQGEYKEYCVPIDPAAAEQFYNHLQEGTIALYQFYEDRYPGELYEAQRECHPEGLYQTIAQKLKIAALETERPKVFLNAREVNALGYAIFNGHGEYDEWLEVGDDNVQERHHTEARMILRLTEDFVTAGGECDIFLQTYFSTILMWRGKENKDIHGPDTFGGGYEL